MMGRKKGIRFVLLVAIALGGALLVRTLAAKGYITEESLKEWIEGWGLWGPLVYILIYTVAPAFMAPGSVLTVVGGMLFGPLWGVVYTAIGATAGATVAFWVARYLGRDWVAERIKGTGLESLDIEVQRRGWKVVALTRLIPLFPFNLLNYAFGLTGIGTLQYVVATLIFMLPGIVGYVLFSDALFELLVGGRFSWAIAAIGLVLFLSVGSFLYRWHRARRG